jgi:hypothetical protein
MDLIDQATRTLDRATKGMEPISKNRALVIARAAIYALLALAQELRTANEIAAERDALRRP